ncbi:MAG: hypothetical protein JMDDDDMK_00026 [Acidobacteria bacterium]|nr:hypothetical protein [Acidobacteriota bacterium]
MLKKFCFSLMAVMALSLVAMAQGNKSVTLTGNIVDKACSARVSKKEDVQAAAAGHTKNCALMENCAKSGFGVFAGGKWTEFDEKGNAMAKAALEKSKKDKGATFKVTGKVADGKMAVESISEVE